MGFREVTENFYATRLLRDDDESCSSLDGYDLSGDVEFKAKQILNDGFNKQGQIVNGREVVQFTFGDSSFCVERVIYEASTKEFSKD
jgi:hypothetical protein